MSVRKEVTNILGHRMTDAFCAPLLCVVPLTFTSGTCPRCVLFLLISQSDGIKSPTITMSYIDLQPEQTNKQVQRAAVDHVATLKVFQILSSWAFSMGTPK